MISDLQITFGKIPLSIRTQSNETFWIAWKTDYHIQDILAIFIFKSVKCVGLINLNRILSHSLGRDKADSKSCDRTPSLMCRLPESRNPSSDAPEKKQIPI